MLIHIKTVGKQEEDFYLTVKPTSNIFEVKLCVEVIQSIPIESQTLFYGDNLLDDDENNVSFYKIQDGSKLFLLPKPINVRIMMVDLKREIGTITVEPFLPVEEMKLLVHSTTGISSSKQLLLYKGKQLEDQHTLQEYGIKADSTIDLVLRLS